MSTPQAARTGTLVTRAVQSTIFATFAVAASVSGGLAAPIAAADADGAPCPIPEPRPTDPPSVGRGSSLLLYP